MKLESPRFLHGKAIPSEYTCKGAGSSPPLEVIDAPASAKSLAIIMHDPDAPAGDWVHWLVWNITPQTIHIETNAIFSGAQLGASTGGVIGYEPPCPPSGTHRYIFELYALESSLELASGSTREQLHHAMQGHIITEAQLIGLCSHR